MPTIAPDADAGAGTSLIPAELQAFVNIAEAWGLSTDEQLILLGSPGRPSYVKWKKDGGALPKDTVERISHVLAIFKALQILLPDETAADGWVKRPNTYFGGQTALEVMLSGFAELYSVRAHLDAQRGG